jgi:hypothetical protein
MPGKLQKSDVLFRHPVQNPNRAEFVRRKPDDLSPRPAELALQWLQRLGRNVEMLVKKLLENVHVDMLLSATTKDNIEPATRKAVGHQPSQ